MEEKKQIKISLKTAIIFILAFILVVGVSIFIYNRYFNNGVTSSYRNGDSVTIYSNSKTNTSGKEVEYDTKIGYYSGTSDCIENAFISSYNELETYLSHFGEVTIDDQNVLEIFDKDFFKNNTIAIEAHDASSSHDSYKIDSVKVDGTEANINIDLTTYSYGGVFAPTVQFRFIILDNNIKSAKFNINTKKVDNTWDYGTVYKPIIYLYPTQDMEVSVKLGYNENITVSYPKYLSAWNVLAKIDGTIIDLETNRNLYALYYESENTVNFKVEKDGFVVKGENVATFLEEKLSMLGLTEREAEEFIIYWLPILQENEYNYIRFATIDQINENMPLDITPNPDTIIRVLMTYKGLENSIEIEEQQLITPERNGFVAVEWGGTEIK